MLENVPGLASISGGGVLREIVRSVERKGYVVSVGFLNAKDFGLFQNRKRLFLIGIRGNLHTRPFAFSERNFPNATYASIKDRHKRDSLPPGMKRRLEKCANALKYPVFMRVVVRPCEGSKHIAPTLTRSGRGTYYSGSGQRSSVREELRMQGFPEDFSFPKDMSLHHQRQLIGNSMAVNVIAEIIRDLRATGVFPCLTRRA